MLPIKTSLTVKPWFLGKTLHEAENLLEQEDCLILHYRSASAALFSGLDGFCLIDFKYSPNLSQGFRLSHATCSICAHSQKIGDRCVHAAALTVKIMRENSELDLFPAPLLFADSKWQQLSTFLNGQSATPKIRQDDTDECRLTFQTADFTLQVSLAKDLCGLLPMRFNSYQFPELLPPPWFKLETVAEAWQHLLRLCRSDSEESLNELGRISTGQERAGSLWTLLCHNLFLEQTNPDWQLRRSADNSLSLVSGRHEEVCLTPNRNKLISLLKQTGNLDLISITGTVRAYSKIYFQEDNSLVIEPWLELDDNIKRRRTEMADFIYSGYCSLAGNVFSEIREQEDDFTPTATSGDLPLMAFAEKINTNQSRTIPASDVPAFLDKHLRAILSGRHEPEAALKEFSINDLPDVIEVLDYNEDSDWCYLSARYTCGDRQLDLGEIMALRSRGQEHAIGKGKWLQLNNTPLDWFYELGKDRLQGERGERLRLTRLEMMALTALVPKLNLPTHEDKRQIIQSRLQNLRFAELNEADVPGHLRPYQRTGLTWLHHLHDNGIGGILADDMGLGKTHQALAMLQIALRAQEGPALVICPASVLPHWQDKIDSFYPGLNYNIYYGQGRSLSAPTTAQLMLTTYGVMRQDIDLLEIFHFGLIFFDEIQYLKNRKTSTSRAAHRLLGGTCFGLSGTPIENSLTDLKAIYDLCIPGLLGRQSDFKKTYVVPIEENNDPGRLASLQRLIQPFMLRRDKSMVLKELPEVIDDTRFCYLSADQQSLYQQTIDGQGRKLLAAVNDTSAPFPHLSFLALVQRLKQICNHPCQLTGSSNYEKYSSGKWELFKEILNECLAEGLKVVVFSQYTTMLDIIEQYLEDMKIPKAGLRGSSSMTNRQQQVESFNNDPEIKIFCASLLAGGTGIDLTGAQVVIHYDRWWNSAKEEQATARVHRFGQRQAVQVFKFITTGTLEEKIHRLITKKQNLATDTVTAVRQRSYASDDGTILKKLSREEIASILQWLPVG